jgi:hypothetical protein
VEMLRWDKRFGEEAGCARNSLAAAEAAGGLHSFLRNIHKSYPRLRKFGISLLKNQFITSFTSVACETRPVVHILHGSRHNTANSPARPCPTISSALVQVSPRWQQRTESSRRNEKMAQLCLQHRSKRDECSKNDPKSSTRLPRRGDSSPVSLSNPASKRTWIDLLRKLAKWAMVSSMLNMRD